MNANLLQIIKETIAKYGEPVLSEPKRVSALFADLAGEVPKPQKNAFVKCLEHGFVQIIKNAGEDGLLNCKQGLVDKLHEEEGFDLGLCKEAIDLLEVVLFGEAKKKILCKKCGKELLEEWKVCPFCATLVESQEIGSNSTKNMIEVDIVKRSQNIWICGKCSEKNDLDLDFCHKCRKEFWPPL